MSINSHKKFKSVSTTIINPTTSLFTIWHKRLSIAFFVFLLLGAGATELCANKLRVGVLKFGTVNWELNVIQHHGYARQEGVELEIVKLASKNATAVALQSGSVDMIVTDWVWVSRQRAEGCLLYTSPSPRD